MTRAKVAAFLGVTGIAEEDVFLMYTPEGSAFVRARSEPVALGALQRSRAMLGKRYIEVLRAAAGAAEAAVAQRTAAGQTDADRATVCRVRGLPWQATREGVLAFFDGTAEVTHVHFVLKQARPSGEALIEFASEADATAALTKDKAIFEGGRWLEIMAAAKGEVYAYQATQQPTAAAAPLAGLAKWVDPLERLGGCGEGGPRVVAVKGLPVAATKPEIVAHFHGAQLFPAAWLGLELRRV